MLRDFLESLFDLTDAIIEYIDLLYAFAAPET